MVSGQSELGEQRAVRKLPAMGGKELRGAGLMKILLFGKNGQVGWELQRTLAPLGELIALGQQEMDLTDPDSITRVIRQIRPGLIVNAAGYTSVDNAEHEPDLAMTINGIAPG